MQSLSLVVGGDVASAGSANCLQVGTRVAEFEITGIVGEGGFGIVYLAFDHSLRRVVAVKEYMPGVMAGRDADGSVVVRSKRHREAFDIGLRSFINEARLLAQFDHPSLIRIHRFWEQNQTGYMAMRFYEGRTLKRILQDDPGFVSELWLKRMLRSVLRALDALYKVQILHRDISPENIMIQSDGETVLLDFGAARQVIGGITQAVTVILKPGYAPIEQYADDPSLLQGPWTDIYSLSAVIYGAITGCSPPSSVSRMINDPIVSLAGLDRPGYSAPFLRAIDCGLCVRPEQRPQSIAAFLALLDADESPRSILRTHADSADQSRQGSPAPAHEPPLISPARHSGAAPSPAAKPAGRATYIATASAMWNAVGRQICSLSSRRMRQPLSLAALAAVLVVACGFGIRSWRYQADRSSAGEMHSATSQAPEHATTRGKRIAGSAIPAQEIRTQHVATAIAAAVPANSPSAPAPAPAPPGPTMTKGENLAAAGDKKATVTASTAPTASKQGAGAPASGGITLLIKPWGNVFVDGVAKGVSPPLKRLALADGPHVVKVTNPNFPDYVTHIAIGKKRIPRVAVDFAAAGP